MTTETLAARGRVGAGARLAGRPGFQHVLRSAAETIMVWQERAQMRHALAYLDDRMLRDIGVTRAEAEGEMAKPFWRA